jgi:hypothetical protein
MKIIYFLRDNSACLDFMLEDCGPRFENFLHIEGSNFTVYWDDKKNFSILNLPVKIETGKIIPKPPEIDIGPPIEKVEYLEIEDATSIFIIEVDKEHPLYKLIFELKKYIEETKKLGENIIKFTEENRIPISEMSSE